MTQTATTITVDSLPIASTIDPIQDRLLIYTASATDIQGISRNTLLGLASTPLGLTDTQSPTNKTFGNTNSLTILDSNLTIQDNIDPTKQAQFQLSGNTTGTTRVYSLPNATDTLAGIAATQTLTNKTLTAPVISGGSADNIALTVDTVSGHTSANSGTIYGISISSGVITTTTALGTGTVPTAALQANSVTYAKLATGTTRLGYGIDAGSTLTTSYVTHATVTATSHGGVCEVAWGALVGNGNSGGNQTFTVQVLCDGVAVPPNSLIFDTIYVSGATTTYFYGFIHNSTPSAGSHTWNLQFLASNTGAVVLANNYLRITEVA